jgi:hypothetical protein
VNQSANDLGVIELSLAQSSTPLLNSISAVLRTSSSLFSTASLSTLNTNNIEHSTLTTASNVNAGCNGPPTNRNSSSSLNSSSGSVRTTPTSTQALSLMNTPNTSQQLSLQQQCETEDTCTITSALKHYLIHLKEPLMTFEYNQQFLIACNKEPLRERICEIHRLLFLIPEFNYEAIELLIKHLYKYESVLLFCCFVFL